MKQILALACCALVSSALCADNAVYIGGAGSSWADPGSWEGGRFPKPGDTATFNAPGNAVITIPNGSAFSLSSIFVNTDGTSRTWAFSGETNTLTDPAYIFVSNGTLRVEVSSALTGTDGFTFEGARGNLELQGTNFFTGPVTVLSGRALPLCDESLGQLPGSVLLDGGMLGNLSVPVTLHADRTVTAGPNGAYLHGRNRTVGASALTIDSQITGTGPVTIIRQTDEVMFRNTANDYAGDTILGANMPVGYYSAADGTTTLTLGADEVIPHGTGKGRLVFSQNMDGILDLNGHSETVNAIDASSEVFAIANSATATPGTLRAGFDNAGMSLSGTIGVGATLDKVGGGTLHFADAPSAADATSSGTLAITGGTLAISDPALWGGLGSVTLRGGSLLTETNMPGLTEYRSALSSSQVNTNATDFTFTGIFPTPRKAATSSISDFPNNTQYLYEGEWYAPVTDTYSFGKAFDDGAALIIDGETILIDNSSGAVAVTNGIPLTAGWHAIQIYVSQGGGSVGPRTVNGFTSALLYDPANGPITNGAGLVENAYPFTDPGDGSALRTRPTAAAVAHTPLFIEATAALDRSAAPGIPLTWAANIVSAPGATLTVTGSADPITIGSPDRPAIFNANLTDPNGVRFQDKVWIKTLPGQPLYGPAADLAAGIPEILGTGPQDLTDYSLRLPAPDSLGDPAAAPVTVRAGRTLTFDSTTEDADTLIDDPGRAFTASNAVTLAGGTLAFDGAGTVTLAAAFTGPGTLHKAGSGTAVLAVPSGSFTGPVTVSDGTLVVSEDAALGHANNPITVTGGALDLSALTSSARTFTVSPEAELILPASPFTLTGLLTGTYTKTGAASLTFGGTTPTPNLDLYVTEGAVTLDKTPGPAVRHILGVDTGASVTLAQADQIAGGITLTGGTLDFAGHSETVAPFSSALAPSAFANSGVPATLTITGETSGNFVGAIPGDIALVKNGTGSQAISAYPGQPTASSLTIAQGDFALGLGARFVRFTVTQTRGGLAPAISEFTLTRNGQPLDYAPASTNIAGSSEQGTNIIVRATDNDTRTCWVAAAPGPAWLVIDLAEPTLFDGYRWYSGARTASAAGNDPVSWTVEISADNACWHTVDARSGVTLPSNSRSVKAGDFAFASGAWPSAALAPGATVSVAAESTLANRLPGVSIGTLSGAGTLQTLRGSSLNAADTSAFTGTILGAGDLLLATDAALDIPVTAVSSVKARYHAQETIHLPAAFPTVRNATAASLSAVIGQNGGQTFIGKLADGAAPIGLTKSGTGTTRLFDTGSDYTGDTRIEAGTLAIRPGTWTFRHIRYDVTAAQNDGKDSNGYELAYGEFQLLLNGQPARWPDGTTATAPVHGTHNEDVPLRAIDGNPDTRWLSQPLQKLDIDTQTGITFDGYRVYSSGGNAADYGRTPKTWTLQGSDDGINWVPLDSQANVPSPAHVGGSGQIIGTFELAASPRASFPSAFRADTPRTNLLLSAVTAQRISFTVLANRDELTTGDSGLSGYQLAELQLLRNGEVIDWLANAIASTPGGAYVSGTTTFPVGKIIDNDIAPSNENRFYSDSSFNPITIDAKTNLTFDAYRWVTAYNTPPRDPTSWRLSVTDGAGNHYLVDERAGETVSTGRGAIIGPFPIRLPAGMIATEAIPDASRVSISSGATLALENGAIETVGPLSGAGTVALSGGATLDINAFEDAAFTGAFTGGGSLRLSGDSTQTFTGGSLGITALELNGTATFAGAASIPGDLSVRFGGGAYGATLNVTGALTVIGPVVYPMSATLPYTRTLFTFTDIDTPSRDALLAGAVLLDVPPGYAAKVTFTPTAATLSITNPGLILMLR